MACTRAIVRGWLPLMTRCQCTQCRAKCTSERQSKSIRRSAKVAISRRGTSACSLLADVNLAHVYCQTHYRLADFPAAMTSWVLLAGRGRTKEWTLPHLRQRLQAALQQEAVEVDVVHLHPLVHSDQWTKRRQEPTCECRLVVAAVMEQKMEARH